VFNDELRKSASAGEQERRDEQAAGSRMLGRIISCTGSRAVISAVAIDGETDLTQLWSVGRLISISVGNNRVVALTYAMGTDEKNWLENQNNVFHVEAELLGEIYVLPDGREKFSTGITHYPYLGAIAHRIRATDLLRIYDNGKADTCVIGKLTQDETIDATINIPEMLSKHFAVVGSTGVGKSTAVSLLLHKAIEADPKLRVLILDPHNEFAAAFPSSAVVIDTDTLDLPFWLMKLEEFAEVLFRGNRTVPEELDILRDIIPEAKRAFRGPDTSTVRRASERSSLTADTPVPYRMADLLALIDDRIGRLEGRNDKPLLRSLKMRIMSAINDPRYHFMFSNNTISDTIMETVAHIFRIPGDGRPISTFQLAGIPSEVVNSVASVLCRMAFELALWSNGAIHMLVVCEEAHRYVPSNPDLGFLPTRQAIARIAKEGRKYGVSLGIITQRPGELDQTILSQCSTLFAMRLSNDRDQEIVRSAIPNSSMSTTSFLSSIGNGEAIAFGEAISVPMRMRFARVAGNALPKANGIIPKMDDDTPDTVDLRSIVSRMRAVAGPNISGFQQSYLADNPFTESDGTFDFGEEQATDAELESWNREIHASSKTQEYEPYNPAMLPRRLGEKTPETSPAASPVTYRNTSGETRDLHEARPAAMSSRPEPPLACREPGLSLRESLLKRPLGSLYKKD
jgi:DNA helicase HerA-like ATPase